MTTTTHLAPHMEAASAEPTLDFVTEQIRNGYMAGVTLRTIANPDTPCEVLVPIKLAARIGQLLLDYVEQAQRQQTKERVRVTKEPHPSESASITYRPARRTSKQTPAGVIRFEFILDTRETLRDWLHPLRGAFYLKGVRQELVTDIYLPKGYWSAIDQRARKPADREKRQLAFTEERIQRVNAQLATLRSRVQVAYLALPEDQRTAENVQRRLTAKSLSTASTHQHAA